MFGNVERPCSIARTIVAKSSSSRTRSAVSRDVGSDRPIAIPMSASCSAGPSLTRRRRSLPPRGRCRSAAATVDSSGETRATTTPSQTMRAPRTCSSSGSSIPSAREHHQWPARPRGRSPAPWRGGRVGDGGDAHAGAPTGCDRGPGGGAAGPRMRARRRARDRARRHRPNPSRPRSPAVQARRSRACAIRLRRIVRRLLPRLGAVGANGRTESGAPLTDSYGDRHPPAAGRTDGDGPPRVRWAARIVGRRRRSASIGSPTADHRPSSR